MVGVDRWISDNEFDPRYQFWTRANVSEVLPDPPSPLSWGLVWEGGAIQGWRDLFIKRCGMGEDELSTDRCEAVGIFGGYAYLGAALFRVWAGRTPGMTPTTIDEAYFGDHPDVPPYVAEPWHTREATTARMAEYMQWATGPMTQDELEADRLDSLRIVAARPDYATLSDTELLDYALSLRPTLRRMFDQHINQSIAASIGPGVLSQICAAVGRPADAGRLMVGFGTVDSALPSYAMWDLSRQVRASAELTGLFAGGPSGLGVRLRAAASGSAEVAAFVTAFDGFLAEFGSRGLNEWDLVAPSWEVNHDAPLALIDRMRLADDSQSPYGENGVREAERTAVAAEIAAVVAGDPEAAGAFDMGLRAAATFSPGRERSKTTIIRVVNEVRMAARELGRRAAARGDLADPDDVFMLFLDEARQLTQGTLANSAALAAPRWAYRRYLQELEPPFIINGAAPPVERWARRDAASHTTLAAGDQLKGELGCPGVARGRARVVLDPTDPTALEPGDILVAPMTDPSWTPLFVPAAAVVVDTGAALSHAMIVSRELGIPCVPSALHATRRIPDGALIEVDGTSGTVTVIELP
jgi:pyruvate,water dikinase